MKRKKDIQQKLAYALTSSKAFGEEVTKGLIAGTQPLFLGDKLASILAACRECFDYAAKDIAEALTDKPSGNVYFPFSTESLGRKPWVSTQHVNSRLVRRLRRLIKRIERDAAIAGTHTGHSILPEINSIVNDKKHNVITVANARENSRTLVQVPGGPTVIMSPMMEMRGGQLDRAHNLPAPEVIVTNEIMKTQSVPDFRLAFNNVEVTAFARESIEATWRVLGGLYKACFGLEEGFFNPHEAIKSDEQKALDSARRSLAPMIYRPLAASALRSGEKVLEVRMSPNGEPESKDPELRAVALALRDLFTAYVWPNFGKAKTDAELQASMPAMALSSKDKYWLELSFELEGGASLPIQERDPLVFDKIVYGIGLHVRSTLAPQLPLHHQPEHVNELISAVFGEHRTMGAIYKDPIPMPKKTPSRWLRTDSWTVRVK